MRILIIEDDHKIVKFLSQGLREEGYVVSTAKDGKAGLDLALAEDFDFIILDLMLPKLDGLSLCRALRHEGRKAPILMLTARETVEDRVAGLDAGADDYLVKPFAFRELLARLRALSRRKHAEGPASLETAGLKMDLAAHKVFYRGQPMELTGREFALLRLFMGRKGHALSRTLIIESVWGYDFQSGTNIIDVYINYLRNKLKRLTGREWIKTVRGRGYSFEEPTA